MKLRHTHGMFCSVFGCSHTDGEIGKPIVWTSGPEPHGCICPAGAEKTCKGPLCPRREIKS